MFVVNEDNSIYVTRGDTVFFLVTAEENGENHIFKAGDVIRFKVFGKKDCEKVVLQKDFPITQDSEHVQIVLTENDTKFEEVISKPKDYWYEVELNPFTNPQTIIGYDDDGAKIFKLYPEGDDVPEFVPDPEDIRVMDTELDMTSTRPVQNQAIARAMATLKGDFAKTRDMASAADSAIATERARLDNLISHNNVTLNNVLEYMDYITETTKSKIDGRIESDGVHATIRLYMHEANLIYGGTNMDVFIIPNECRPIDTGLIHTADGMEYRINYDSTRRCYALNFSAIDTVAPSSAGSVSMTYALGDYEMKDIRSGFSGNIHSTAGNAVRIQVENIVKNIDEICSGENINVFWRYALNQNAGSCFSHFTGEVISTLAVYSRSGYIPVVPGQKVTVYEPEPDGKCVSMMGAYFDADKNLVKGMGTHPDYKSGEPVVVTIPDGIYYMAVNYHVDYAHLTKVIPHNTLPWQFAGSDHAGKVWCCVGDSLTEVNQRAEKHYYDYIAEDLGLSVLNYGVSGTGYKNGSFANRIAGIKEDFDFMTMFGSFNDLDSNWPLGTVTDTDRTTLCGCMNAAVNNFYAKFPTKKLAIITPTPWKLGIEYFGVATTLENMEDYVNALIAIAKRHRIPCLDLYHCSGLNPDNPSVFTTYYNENGTQDVGVHPNSAGHKFIAQTIKEFIKTL